MTAILRQEEIDNLSIRHKVDEIENAIVNAKLLLQSINSERAEDLHDILVGFFENDLTKLYEESESESAIT